MSIETGQIKEIYSGHFQLILDFPTPYILKDILDLSYKYVWGFNHVENPIEWSDTSFHLYGQDVGLIKTRNIYMEYLIETTSFLNLIPFIHRTVQIIQTNQLPPSYLNLKLLQGKPRYDLLKEKVNYLFEIEIPGSLDYAPIISPNRDFLLHVLHSSGQKN